MSRQERNIAEIRLIAHVKLLSIQDKLSSAFTAQTVAGVPYDNNVNLPESYSHRNLSLDK